MARLATKDSIWEPEDYLNYYKDILKEYWDQGPQSANCRKRSNTIVLLQPIKKACGRPREALKSK